MTQVQLRKRVAPFYKAQRKKHIQEVLRAARAIKASRLTPLQRAIIYYHDIQKKRVGNNGHQEAGAKFAQKALKGQYSPQEVKLIANAIREHSPQYRFSIPNFKHSSREAQLLALADDVNVKHRDPDLMAAVSVKFIKQHPQMFNNDINIGYNRHVSFFGPAHAHQNLSFYDKQWKQLMKRPMKEVDNYPKSKWRQLWKKINKDSQVPDIDSIYYNP